MALMITSSSKMLKSNQEVYSFLVALLAFSLHRIYFAKIIQPILAQLKTNVHRGTVENWEFVVECKFPNNQILS